MFIQHACLALIQLTSMLGGVVAVIFGVKKERVSFCNVFLPTSVVKVGKTFFLRDRTDSGQRLMV